MWKDRKDKNKKSKSNLNFFYKLTFYLLAGYLIFFTSLLDYINQTFESIQKEEASQVTEAVEQEPVPVPISPAVPKKKVKESCKKIIKGNISSSGEKIYHLPGGDYYYATVAEESFCNQAEAMAAGYRKSKR